MNAAAGTIHSPARPDRVAVSRSDWLVITGGLIGGFMAILDIQITLASMKVIQAALSASLEDSSWLMTSYFTAEIVAIPLCGWFAQAFGTRRYALWCLTVFLIASLLCSLAWSLPSMIIFRILQGFGGGALIPISFRLIIEILPAQQRPLGMALFSIISTFAPAIGPALGGWLSDTFSWHAIFYINIIPALLAITLIGQGMISRPIQWQIIRDGDYIGVITAMLSLGSLQIILEEGRSHGWLESDLICFLSIIALFCFIIFLHDQRHHPRPLLSLQLFRDPSFCFGMLLFAMLGCAIYGTLFLVPYFLTMVHDYNASQIGAVVIWMGLPQLLILPFIPALCRLINLKYLIAAGFAGLALSAYLNSQMDINFAGEQMRLSLLVRALSQPFIMVPLAMLATRNVSAADGASSAILINVSRSIGGSCGTAILSTLFMSHTIANARQLQTTITTANEALPEYFAAVKALLLQHGGPIQPEQIRQTAFGLLGHSIRQQAEISGFNAMFYLMAVMMLAAALIAIFCSRDYRILNH